MAKTVNTIRKNMVKKDIFNGMTPAQAMRNNGYSENYIKHRQDKHNKLLQVVNDEIKQELKAKDITVDLITKHLYEDRELARNKGDISTMTRCDELLGKYIAMFTDKTEQTGNQQLTINVKDHIKEVILNRLHPIDN